MPGPPPLAEIPLSRLSGPLAGALLPVLVLGLGLFAAGCGHKASDADCAFILDRNVEVQMKAMHITDPVAIDKRKQEIQAELKGQLQGCIGKRITDGMLACVARAQTAEAIDACMR
jgi:hypothetical protein